MIDEREILAIIEREGLWREAPPDPPTMRGITLPRWVEYCTATHQTFRAGKRFLRTSTEADALAFYRWYFPAKGLDVLIQEFAVPPERVPLLMDLRTQHSLRGCREILRFAAAAPDPQAAVITLSRIRYIVWLAGGRQPHLRRDLFGLVRRTLKAIGWLPAPYAPPLPPTEEV